MRPHPSARGLLALALFLSVSVSAQAHPRRTPVVEVVERVKAAVVNIHSERSAKGFGPDELFALAPSQNRVNGMGTGILIDPRGYLVTNHHVVDEVNVLRVRLADGTTTGARIIARDPENDLALLKIEVSKPLPVVPLGTAADLMVGETVIAIGNAYGYEHSVTVGVVSAVKRDVTLNKDISYKALIQTDASINPGNSGGPLLNINGELVGVNVAIRAGAQGIGFAIPVDTMIRVTADMLSVRRRNGWTHGLVCRDVVETESEREAAGGTENEATKVSVKTAPATTFTRRLVVEHVEAGSPAAKAGLQRGDVVTRVGDQAVTCSLELERGLLDRSPGDHVPLVVVRGGSEQKPELVLTAPERVGPAPADVVWWRLGVRLNPVGAEVVARTNKQLHGGLTVGEVRPDSAAGRAGLQRGDILVGLHTWEMLTLDNVLYVLNHPDLPALNPVRFYIIRAGQVHQGWLQQVE